MERTMDEAVARRIATDPLLAPARELLMAYKKRVSDSLPASHYDELSALKQEFVAANDQEGAKAVWCLEMIGKVQDQFIEAFRNFKEHRFYTGWCLLERCEIDGAVLQRHYQDENGRFGIGHVVEHGGRFQALFPYKLFMSPGFLKEEIHCGICNARLTPRSDCGHVIGEIYNGEYCSRHVVKAKLLEVSLTPNPVQKSAVPFSRDSQLNYGNVKYVVDGVRSPWHGWSYEEQPYLKDHPPVPSVGRNDRCACGSGLKYKKCGLIGRKEEAIHTWIRFEYPPPPTLPKHVPDMFFTSDIDHPISKGDSESSLTAVIMTGKDV